MPNENCLVGIKCPKCGYEDGFNIECGVWCDVTDDGADPLCVGDIEWGGDSRIECQYCHHTGTVKQFEIEE